MSAGLCLNYPGPRDSAFLLPPQTKLGDEAVTTEMRGCCCYFAAQFCRGNKKECLSRGQG